MKKELKLLHNPELISIDVNIIKENMRVTETNRHIPYGIIDNELTYNSGRIPTIPSLEKKGYKINERLFSDISQLFSKDYKQFNFDYSGNDGIYIGAEHCSKDSSIKEILQKKPNLTFFGNLEAKLYGEQVIIMGSSMGHAHLSSLEIQEIYEFQGYGVMVINKPGKSTDMVFMKPGGKVTVPNNCHMTIYNLDKKPLETHDFANPMQNESDKNLEREKGPIFCIYYSINKETLFFNFNPRFLNSIHPLNLSIPLHIPKHENFGETVFYNSRQDSFRKKFGKINISNCYKTKIPGVNTSEKLKKLVELKSPKFCRLFNIS